MKLETRLSGMYLPVRAIDGLNLRTEPNSTGGTMLAGYAVVYNAPSKPMLNGRLIETISPGAFKQYLADSKNEVRALVDHDPTKILGKRSNGTLRVFDDAVGIRVEIDPPDTSYGRDIVESVRRGDTGGMSFGFRLPDQNSQRVREERGMHYRTIVKAELFEVTATSIPDYPDTVIECRVDEELAFKRSESGSVIGGGVDEESALRLAKYRMAMLSVV